MKRYLIFLSPRYYPGGGMYDFMGDYDDFAKALEALTELPEKENLNWGINIGHIYDSIKKKIIYERDGNIITLNETTLDREN